MFQTCYLHVFSFTAPPFITSFTAQQSNGVAGGNASFTCIVVSTPVSNITWMVNGTVLEVDSITTTTDANGITNSTLTLISLDSNNTGNYSCMASNFLAELRNYTSAFLALSVLCEYMHNV